MTQEKFYTATTTTPKSYPNVLIIDDNDFYAAAIQEDLASRGSVEFTRAKSAAEGIALIDEKGAGYDLIVTDISMETEYAGVKVLAHLKKLKLPGDYAVATTALNYWFGFYPIGAFYKRLMRVDYMVPKRPIRNDNKVLWIKGIHKSA